MAKALDEIAEIAEIMENPENVNSSEASAMDTKVGAAVTILVRSLHPRLTRQIGIGSAHNGTVHAAEPTAIDCTVEAIQEEATDQTLEETELEKRHSPSSVTAN
ncbi:hypothetical protein EPUS_07125 [Endocarpon pusillum Z07020]|uniref:Uncharacterized protein n=1 Tax=Endocarpon pusillum (strain Z07020 / HMAS-L-300199) TaxID=1263415 RepID=U1GM96_ENDPU|nr:uncharacterized protein EPUS_07125 [Endocarpon pusillum Z07020]ERF73031.1 hypothetical protein EPUS_07125 [Endocarpon pusillum Z07020]